MITPGLSEAQFQNTVVEAARLLGWTVHFVPDALYRRSFTNKRTRFNALDLGDRGFPDLLMVKGSRILYRELKVGRNKLSDHQQAWRDRLLAAGADWQEWRPEQMDDILADLQRT
jgi:hypothetical protein